MNDVPFSNREINEMFQTVQGSLGRIEQQTTKHNGRMTKMEHWQAFISGGFSIVVLIVIPILGWALYELANIQEIVNHSVNQALASYNIEVK